MTQRVAVSVKYRIGLSGFSGVDLEQSWEQNIEDDEDAAAVAFDMTQELCEELGEHVEQYKPFMILEYVNPETRRPYPHVVKLFQGLPLLEDE